ncbi:ABC transporter permease [Nostoc sp. 'Peltigera membranacea cyanobiont' 210A]|uniref:ABC transporter permease subunit n=1 Tax=Nostoc sp. 'Peltigera membranacea cyanobiont' 210A TaxID=2014529 RepID=UPI000B95C101|nr:ABC transporter permease subunit [Nostoc sp. 'Peltigera membranacea cyanobiont' 210A]OYD96305.1 ABC transporter permease [Nostoc sp. 'Peltigera membranacea cyanobiont' 210A]
MLNLIDKIGDWNPQLFRELKGQFKFVNVAIASVTSLLLQLVVTLYHLSNSPDNKYSLTGTYCRLRQIYEPQQTQLFKESNQSKIDELNDFFSKNFCPQNQIDWQLWWREHWEYIFLTFSVIFLFTLLVAGTYLLINDFAKEETRGTLNFIRLSPQSETSILTGKLLGVPSLIYLMILVAVPLHLWAGLSAKIAFSYILGYYAILAGSCIFFYSAALLLSLFSRSFSGSQPLLGLLVSGVIFMFLFITMLLASSYNNSLNNSTAWFRLFNPWDTTNYLFPRLFNLENGSNIKQLQFFYLPLGRNIISVVGFHLLNLGLCSYGILQILKRCFRNPQASIISKKQSYLLVTFCQLMIWGFTLQIGENSYTLDQQVGGNYILLALYNLVLILSLIAVLSPHRQDVQDWARYRHQGVSSQKSIWQDLIWAEKSPALVAIAINLTIVNIPWLIWISFTSIFDTNNGQTWLGNDVDRFKVLLAIALSISVIMIYATIAQLILLLKTPKRSFWAIRIIGAAVFLPPIILEFIGITSQVSTVMSTVWLFSTFPWAGIQGSGTTTVFMAFLAELTFLGWLNLQLTRQVRLAGESATKALLA